MSWYRLLLGDGLLATTPLNDIEDAFLQLYPGGDAPMGAAVFSEHRLEGLHCQVTVYFSPTLSSFARRFGAQPCLQPVNTDLELLHGTR